MKKDNSQLDFTKNRWKSWFSHQWLKISKCSISLVRMGKCSKSKVTPLSSKHIFMHQIFCVISWITWKTKNNFRLNNIQETWYEPPLVTKVGLVHVVSLMLVGNFLSFHGSSLCQGEGEEATSVVGSWFFCGNNIHWCIIWFVIS